MDFRRGGRDLRPLPGGLRAGWLAACSSAPGSRLDVGFNAAQARLTNLVRGGLLRRASGGALHDWQAGLALVEPRAAALGMSELVQVRFRDRVIHGDSAVWAMRWEVIGPGGSLFPAVDADIVLTPAGEDATMLAVSGAYRPPATISPCRTSVLRVAHRRVGDTRLAPWARDWTGRSCTGSPRQRSGSSPITSGQPSCTRPPRPQQDMAGYCRKPGPSPRHRDPMPWRATRSVADEANGWVWPSGNGSPECRPDRSDEGVSARCAAG